MTVLRDARELSPARRAQMAGWLREPEPEPRDLSPEQVIAWLRSPEGERWSEARLGGELERQDQDSGVFADVRDTISSVCPVQSRWPYPYSCHDISRHRH
jgi:hypothetical protein